VNAVTHNYDNSTVFPHFLFAKDRPRPDHRFQVVLRFIFHIFTHVHTLNNISLRSILLKSRARFSYFLCYFCRLLIYILNNCNRNILAINMIQIQRNYILISFPPLFQALYTRRGYLYPFCAHSSHLYTVYL